jgi:multiple antibiotic resistance protein
MGRADGNLLAIATVIAMLLTVMMILLAALLTASKIMDVIGISGAAVLRRTFGIVLSALAVQLIVSGIAESFPALIAG